MTRFATIGLVTILVLSSAPFACADNEAETRLIHTYLQAHNAKDLEGVLSLFLERLDTELGKQLRIVLAYSFRTPIKKIELVPEKPDPKPVAKAHGGKKESDFKVTHNLVVHLPDEAIAYTRISLPVGGKDGRLYLAPVPPVNRK